MLQRNGKEIDLVLELLVDEEAVIRRIAGRRFHENSGRSYHVEFNPPKNTGLDDPTGEPLIQREDDNEKTVRARLKTYAEQTAPLVDYYRGMKILKCVDGMGEPNEVFKRIQAVLAEKISVRTEETD